MVALPEAWSFPREPVGLGAKRMQSDVMGARPARGRRGEPCPLQPATYVGEGQSGEEGTNNPAIKFGV